MISVNPLTRPVLQDIDAHRGGFELAENCDNRLYYPPDRLVEIHGDYYLTGGDDLCQDHNGEWQIRENCVEDMLGEWVEDDEATYLSDADAVLPTEVTCVALDSNGDLVRVPHPEFRDYLEEYIAITDKTVKKTMPGTAGRLRRSTA